MSQNPQVFSVSGWASWFPAFGWLRSYDRAWLRGDMLVAHWAAAGEAFLLDVREPAKVAVESAPGAVNIPMSQLRGRLGELPRDREILVTCRSGQRAYLATWLLLQHGFKARNLSGGFLSRAILVEGAARAAAPTPK